jgi:Zn-finger nucleic acid-binding protein
MYLADGRYVGIVIDKCPHCKDVPDGEWFDGSEINHWCGATITAQVSEDKDATRFWKFRLESRPKTKRKERVR